MQVHVVLAEVDAVALARAASERRRERRRQCEQGGGGREPSDAPVAVRVSTVNDARLATASRRRRATLAEPRAVDLLAERAVRAVVVPLVQRRAGALGLARPSAARGRRVDRTRAANAGEGGRGGVPGAEGAVRAEEGVGLRAHGPRQSLRSGFERARKDVLPMLCSRLDLEGQLRSSPRPLTAPKPRRWTRGGGP